MNIQTDKYETVKETILKMLRRYHKCTFSELSDLVREDLAQTFDGRISWYYATVSLDLEARGIIVCDRSGKIITVTLAEEA